MFNVRPDVERDCGIRPAVNIVRYRILPAEQMIIMIRYGTVGLTSRRTGFLSEPEAGFVLRGVEQHERVEF